MKIFTNYESMSTVGQFAVFIVFRDKSQMENEQSVFKKQTDRLVQSRIEVHFVFLKLAKKIVEHLDFHLDSTTFTVGYVSNCQ